MTKERKAHGYWKRMAATMDAQSSKKVKTRSEGNALVGAIVRMAGSASLRQQVSGFIVIRRS